MTRNLAPCPALRSLPAALVLAAILLGVHATRAEDEPETPEETVQAAEYLGTERHALLIGIDEYADRSILALADRESGARAVHDVLVDPQRGGVPADNVRLLLGREATAAAIRAALARLEGVPKEATVLVYFAGHGGAQGEDAYWVTQESKKGDLAGTALSAAELRGLLQRIPAARVLLLMDGHFAAGLVGSGRSRIDVREVLARYAGEGYATLCGGDTKEHAVESEQVRLPVFTHHLVEGLAGAADEGEDGVVDLDELAEFVERALRAEARKLDGLERPLADLDGVPDASRFLLTIEPEGLRERLREDEAGQAERRRRLEALEALRRDEGITAEEARLGRYLLGALAEGFEPHEWELQTFFVDLVDGRLGPGHLGGALAAVRREDRRTLVVPESFETIQAAIDAARAGDTVRVREGTYDEHLVLKTGIVLRGEGRERTVIRMVPGEGEILLAQDCAWGAIEDLQFDGTGGKELEGWIPDGVHLKASSLRVTGCLAHSCLGCGVYVSDAGSTPLIRDCTIQRNGHDGICLRETDGGSIVECICRLNGAVGIQVRQCRGEVVVKACLCEQDAHAGIGVCGGSTVTLVDNICRDNDAHGVIAWDKDTSLSLEGNNCSGNRIYGIYVVQRAQATAKGNECRNNRECGIVVLGVGTRATIVENQFLGQDLHDEGEFAGIVFRDGGRGEAVSNVCDGNTCGILVTGPGASARLADNVCRKNKTSGIAFVTASQAEATGNRCEENGQGITVSSTEVKLGDNALVRNAAHGILIGKRGASEATGNRCEENGEDGIHVTDIGTRVELVKNTCTSNGRDGIRFARSASGTADGNECGGNQAFGVSAYDSGTRPTFRRNRGTGNGRAGVGKEDGAAPVVESGNELSDGG